MKPVIGKILLTALAIAMPMALAGNTEAEEWRHRATVYGWLAGLDGNTRFPLEDDDSLEIDASDILEDLKMVFMGNYEGHYREWSVLADVVYLDLGDSRNVDTELGEVRASLDLKSWVVHGAVGYEVIATERSTTNLVAGVRYLSLDGELETSVENGRGRSSSERESVTDAIVGVRGQFALNTRWFIPYHVDVGFGDTDYSYQLFTGLGYRNGALDFELGYRHLDFEFDDDRFMKDLQISGPAIGVGFRF